jgi:hypothetical protein
MSDLSLEIYHLDVHGGDSTAIIVRDLGQESEKGGKIISSTLIDAGAEGKGSVYLKAYLQKYLTLSFDCIIATHYHQDHIQGFKQADIKFEHFVDNGDYAEESGKTFTPRNDIGKASRTEIFDSYKEQVQGQVKNGAKRFPITFIEKSFDLKKAEPLKLGLGGKDTGITLTCYCANGILAKGDDVLGGQRTTRNKPINPNDVSLAFVLEWGDFRYFTAGDLSGDRTLNSYYNIEEPLVKYLIEGPLKDKKITVFKASHHGSEHSNHDELLKAFKPETIIVCCNIMKQVPSPLFLRRLDTYFKTNANAIAVFTNTMKIFKNDDRYEPLQNIKGAIPAGNVEFSGTGEEEKVASNLGIKCAIVRRRVLDGKQIDYDDKNMPPGTKIIKKSGYNILLPPRDVNEASQVGSGVRFKAYNLEKSWNSSLLDTKLVAEAFTVQAKEMVKWLTTDKELNEQIGINYIKEYYPGLVKIINSAGETELMGKLVEEMKRMFNNSFILNSSTGFYGTNLNNQLTGDEKRTFYALMIDNYHQFCFNAAIGYENTKSKKTPYLQENTWNRALFPEPYPEPEPEPHPEPVSKSNDNTRREGELDVISRSPRRRLG